MLTALAVLVVLSDASEAAKEHAATPVEAPKEAPQPPPGEAVPAEEAPAPAPGPWWQRWTPEGYIKAGLFYTFPLQNEQLVGGNGGFRMLAARLGVAFNPVDNLSVVASIEAAAPVVRSDDPLTGSRVVELRDAYLEYRVCKGFWVRAGQFKAPFNGETLLGDGDLPFVQRSVASEGVAPPEAYGPRDGLTLGRQVGVQLSSDRLGTETIGFRYFVAAVNGNGQNQLFNDSNPIAPVVRLEGHFKDIISLGINGYYNIKTEGVRPNRIDINQLGYGADIAARIKIIRALIGFLGRSNSYAGNVLPPDNAFGVFAQLSAVLDMGIEGGLRAAYYEPSNAQPDDQVYEVNAMIGYRFKKVPLRVIVQYTHRGEAPAVAIQNESLDAMVQVTW